MIVIRFTADYDEKVAAASVKQAFDAATMAALYARTLRDFQEAMAADYAIPFRIITR
jgi:hypothetical protein